MPALWLRKSVPPEERNIVYRAFNAVYGRCEAAYTALVRQLVAFALPTTLVGLSFDRHRLLRALAGAHRLPCRKETRAISCNQSSTCPMRPPRRAPTRL